MVGFDWLITRLGEFLTRIIVAIVIIFIGFIFGKLFGRLLHNFLHEAELNKFVKKAGFKYCLEEALSKIVEWFVYFIAIVVAIDQLGLTVIILYIVSGAILLFFVIALFLGIKDFIPNVISGILAFKKEKIKAGNLIVIGDVEGKVELVGVLETKIITKNNDAIFIPNSLLYKKIVTIKKNSIKE
ncbi:mechanosensitive ion channel [Candidatus Woesearchaeota archaeon]|nr:mechanosensitive ion channel [Candidatus Woesearchaeota archaeon]